VYLGPVVCLIGQRCMSSAEWFILMMRNLGATLIGDTTRGASGNPREYSIASNGVHYAVSTWIAYAAEDGEISYGIENNGIIPDFSVPPGEGVGLSYDSEHDYVLEEAMDYLLLFP